MIALLLSLFFFTNETESNTMDKEKDCGCNGNHDEKDLKTAKPCGCKKKRNGWIIAIAVVAAVATGVWLYRSGRLKNIFSTPKV